MAFPNTNVISKGASVKLQLLSDTGSRPNEFVVTLDAAAALGAGTISVTSVPDVVLQHNEVLRFSNGAAWAINNAAGYTRRSNGLVIDTVDATPINPTVGDKIKFGNHDTIYTVASYDTGTNTLGINPSLRQIVGDNEPMEILVEAIVDLPQTSTLNDVIAASTVAVDVPVVPISQAIPISQTATTYALREMLGITDASPTEAPTTQDGTDHKSAEEGLVKTISTIATKTLTVTGFVIENDRASAEVLDPIIHDSDLLFKSVWVEATDSSGAFRSGVCQITDNGSTDQVTNLQGYNRTLTFNSDFTYISGQDALFAVAA